MKILLAFTASFLGSVWFGIFMDSPNCFIMSVLWGLTCGFVGAVYEAGGGFD